VGIIASTRHPENLIWRKDPTQLCRYPDPAKVKKTLEVTMLRLAGILFSLISMTLAGSAVIAVLTMGMDTLQPILWAAAAGFVVALPVTWFVTKAIYTPS